MTGDGTWTAPGQAFWQKARRDTDWQSWAAPPRPGRGWRIFWRVVAVVVAVGLVAIFVASRWVVPYYAITPGTPLNVSQLISVPAGEAHAHRGGVILTDVTYERLTALGYLTYHFDADAQIVSAAEFTGGASSVAYEEEGVIDMWTAREAAVLVALRELGYHPRAVPVGVAVYATDPGAASDSLLAVGDVVTAIGSTRTPLFGPLVAAVASAPPGSSIRVTYHEFGTTRSLVKSLVVGEVERVGAGSAGAETCVRAGSKVGKAVHRDGRLERCLPFSGQQLYSDVNEPFRVTLAADGIGGPSAGLSFTLGLMEKLDAADLTGGLRVAATGTMANNGSVGAIGGISQKTIAVREAGANVFLVPPANAAVARAHAGPGLRIIAVDSIGQAVQALERLGGRLVPATATR